MIGTIFAIKRFEIHDGDGVRTTVFLKGCPLRCKWCHNPEGLHAGVQIGYHEQRCMQCGDCVTVCDAHSVSDGKHNFDRMRCKGCGACAQECLSGALELYGREIDAQALVEEILTDRMLFAESGGGVTISGGEPMMQTAFTEEVLCRLKEQGIHTALDTCGFAPWESYERVLPYVDLVLFDVKAAQEVRHKALTGQSNARILENLNRLDALGSAVIDVRIPLIPEHNEDQMEEIGALLQKLRNLRQVKVLPYHNYSGQTYAALGMEYPLNGLAVPERAQVRAAVETLRRFGLHATDERGE